MSIKFTDTQNNTLPTHAGNTALSDIWLLAPLEMTASKGSLTPGKQYHTDLDGLGTAIDKADELILTLNDAVTAVSTILTYIDKKEIPDELQSSLWLIASLSELSTRLLESRSDMQFSLDQKKAPAK